MHPFNLVPEAPENVRTSQVNANNATVTWNKPSKNQIRGVVKKYIIKVIDGIGDQIHEEDVVDSTSCTVEYLLPNKNYTVRVAVVNKEHTSAFSIVSFTTPSGKSMKISKKVTVSVRMICLKIYL
jgi:hypothetical protein